MAVLQSSIIWHIGGATGIGIPDRLNITCSKCGREISPNGPRLAVVDDPNKGLMLMLSCPDCKDLTKPNIKV